jgi:hypothetical protein
MAGRRGSGTATVLALGAGTRVGVAAGLAALLWLGVGWALGWW